MQIILSSLKEAEWPEVYTRLTVCFLCNMSICNLSFFPIWFRGQKFSTECASSWSLLNCLELSFKYLFGKGVVSLNFSVCLKKHEDKIREPRKTLHVQTC